MRIICTGEEVDRLVSSCWLVCLCVGVGVCVGDVCVCVCYFLVRNNYKDVFSLEPLSAPQPSVATRPQCLPEGP